MNETSDERLAELVLWLDRKWARHKEEEDLEAASAMRELQLLRASAPVLSEEQLDAARYRFVKRRGWPSATRDGEGGRLWYMDREADNVEIVRAKFDDCVDAAMGPAP